MFIVMGYKTAFVAMLIVVTGVLVDDVENAKDLGVFTVDDSQFRKDRLQWLEKQIMLRSKQDHGAANLLDAAESGNTGKEGKAPDDEEGKTKLMVAFRTELKKLFKNMLDKWTEYVNAAKARQKKITASFAKCNEIQQSSPPSTYSEKFLKFKKTTWECNTRETELQEEIETCTKDVVKKEEIMKKACVTVNSTTTIIEHCTTTCVENTGDDGAYYTEMKTFFKEQKVIFSKNKLKCEQATTNHSEAVEKCQKTKNTIISVTTRCKKVGLEMDGEACVVVTRVTGACNKLEQCYSSAKAQYDDEKIDFTARQESSKSENELWVKINCLLIQVANGKDVCNQTSTSTDWQACLDTAQYTIKFEWDIPEPPPFPRCGKVPEIPCLSGYKQTYWPTERWPKIAGFGERCETCQNIVDALPQCNIKIKPWLQSSNNNCIDGKDRTALKDASNDS